MVAISDEAPAILRRLMLAPFQLPLSTTMSLRGVVIQHETLRISLGLSVPYLRPEACLLSASPLHIVEAHRSQYETGKEGDETWKGSKVPQYRRTELTKGKNHPQQPRPSPWTSAEMLGAECPCRGSSRYSEFRFPSGQRHLPASFAPGYVLW